ncbi:MAG TPA: CBS domain-containing protein [Opitutaceae bacterium]|nr:CBS domain-containing protein [Opitutaceae bacterium]
MKVKDIMTAHARCVAPDNTLVEAAGLMRQFDVGAIPVLEIDRLAGIVTDRDIAIRGVADGRDPNTTPVRDVMSAGVTSINEDDSVEDAVRVMERHQIRRLPVLNRDRKLVGIVALGDIAVASNPAFGGMALREVSESERTMSHRGARVATPGQRLSSPASGPGSAKTPARARTAKRSSRQGPRQSAGPKRGTKRSSPSRKRK